MGYELIAAVDLGSNSFRLQVGRVVEDRIYPLDGLKETVRLAAGLGRNKMLDGASQIRGVDALRRFGERLRGFDAHNVRAVATNTLRVAKNASQFLAQAETALGFPIEVIAGREEARLIYVGVSHTLPRVDANRLVVDIGGGSTEFIIGLGHEPLLLESLFMGCVGFSMQHFPDGRCEKRAFREAEVAAGRELQTIVREYCAKGWSEAYASSGTAKALGEATAALGFGEDGMTVEALEALKASLVRTGRVVPAAMPGVRADRLPVLPGGLAIMLAVMKEFGIERIRFAEGALRLGVLYDLLGRFHDHDLRDATVAHMMRRYEVDRFQAARVAATATELFAQVRPGLASADDSGDARVLDWAARLHEIGISIAHSGYHRHSAYVLANADMPGFSRRDQARLSRLVLGHRGKLERLEGLERDHPDWVLVFCLRLAVLLNLARADGSPALNALRSTRGFSINAERGWLTHSPLSEAALLDESAAWQALGFEYRVRPVRPDAAH